LRLAANGAARGAATAAMPGLGPFKYEAGKSPPKRFWTADVEVLLFSKGFLGGRSCVSKEPRKLVLSFRSIYFQAHLRVHLRG